MRAIKNRVADPDFHPGSRICERKRSVGRSKGKGKEKKKWGGKGEGKRKGKSRGKVKQKEKRIKKCRSKEMGPWMYIGYRRRKEKRKKAYKG